MMKSAATPTESFVPSTCGGSSQPPAPSCSSSESPATVPNNASPTQPERQSLSRLSSALSSSSLNTSRRLSSNSRGVPSPSPSRSLHATFHPATVDHPHPHSPITRLSPYPSARQHILHRERSGSFQTLPMDRERSRSFGSPIPGLGVVNSSLSSIPGSVMNEFPYIPSLNASAATPPCTPTAELTLPGTAGSMGAYFSTRSASDAATSNERARARELEASEKDFTLAELKQALKKERAHSCKMAGELAALKSAAVASQAEAEVHEEGRINGLMRRLDALQKEKGRIIVELEREEEMLTNTLQKKLNEVRREKALLEKKIEKEHSLNLDLKSKLNNLSRSDVTASTTPPIVDKTEERLIQGGGCEMDAKENILMPREE